MKYQALLAALCFSTFTLHGQPYPDSYPRGQEPFPSGQPSYPRSQESFSRARMEAQQSVDPASSTLCQQFAQILQGTPMSSHTVCVVMRPRPTGTVTIAGKPTSSPLVNTAMFSFENLDEKGMALNLGETGLLQEEVEPFLNALMEQEGFVVTALHNHWLNTNPAVIMYIHWYYIGHPIEFAQKVDAAWKVLKQ